MNADAGGVQPTDYGTENLRAWLELHAASARQHGPARTALVAITHGSVQYRDVLAWNATSRHMSWSELYSEVTSGTVLPLKEDWSAELAYTVALQALRPGDREFAAQLYVRLWREGLIRSLPDEDQLRHAQTLIEVLIDLGRSSLAQDLLDIHPSLRALEHDYLWLDTINPFRSKSIEDQADWLSGLYARFAAHGLESPQIADNSHVVPFDRVFVPPVQSLSGGPLVSVIITTFRPTERLFHAVRSALAQSWANLEIILVDDASGPAYAETLHTVSRLDKRIRLIVQDQNTGTYGARNTALQHVSGEFVTGQDDDDWSHPRRIERQLHPLLSNEEVPATRSRAIIYSEDLINTRVGYSPTRPNVSSLMIRRSAVHELGGYDDVRKGADNELVGRLAAFVGATVFEVAEPLALVRIDAPSLSRSDFRPHWRHPARIAYRNAYRYWHKTGGIANDPSLPRAVRPFSAPLRFRQKLPLSVEYDVLFASDWRVRGIQLRGLLNQIDALIAGGKKVAILHLDDAMTFSTAAVKHHSEVLHRLNSGVIEEIVLDDIARIGLIIISSPSLVQFLPEQSVRVKVERVAIVLSRADLTKFQGEYASAAIRAAGNALSLFGGRLLWFAQDIQARSVIREALPDNSLIHGSLPSVVPVESFRPARSYFRSDRPVVGTFGQDDRNSWPADPKVIEELYPADGSMEVRILGGSRTALRLLKRKVPPAAWLTFSVEQLKLLPFLNSLDFFIFQDFDSVNFENATPLHAMAAGCVVILPYHWQQLCGDGAVYAEPSEATDVVRKLYADLEAYRAQSGRAVEYVREHFSESRLNAVIDEALLIDSSQPG